MSDLGEIALPSASGKSKPIKLVRSWDKNRTTSNPASDGRLNKEAMLTSPPRQIPMNDAIVNQSDGASQGSEDEQRAAMMAKVDEDTSRVVDELFREFLTQKMEQIESEYKAKMNTQIPAEENIGRKETDSNSEAKQTVTVKKPAVQSEQKPVSVISAVSSINTEEFLKRTLSSINKTVEPIKAITEVSSDETASSKVEIKNSHTEYNRDTGKISSLKESTRSDIVPKASESKEDILEAKFQSPSADNIDSLENTGLPPLDKRNKDDDDDADTFSEAKLNAGKKPAVKLGVMGIKISQISAELISSGTKTDETKKKPKDEGECSPDTDDDNESSDEDEDSDDDSDGEIDESETGSISDDADKTADASKAKKKKKKKQKHKKKKKHKSSKEREKDKDKKEKEKDKENEKDKDSSKRKHSHHSRSRSRSHSPKRHRSSKSPTHKRERDRRSRSRSGSKSRGRDRRRSRSRSRDRDRYRRRSRSRDRFYGRGRDHYYRDRNRWRRSRSRDRNRRYRSKSRERSRSRDRYRSHDRKRSPEKDASKRSHEERVRIDKAKLREIAIANAFANMQTGQGPQVVIKPDDLAALKAGGKSVEELTDFCKRIQEKTRFHDDSDSDDDRVRSSRDDEEGGPFIHHPFKLRELPAPIVMNIRNAKQLPVLTAQEKAAATSVLRIQFPVSSGSQHRAKESDWVPVEKTTASGTTPTATAAATTTAVTRAENGGPGFSSQPTTAAGAAAEIAAAAASTPSVVAPANTQSAIAPANTQSVVAPATTAQNNVAPEDKVFPDPPPMPIDISALMTERIKALRKLTENPNDPTAQNEMQQLQQQMNQWAQSKQLPGQFTGTTGANVLSMQELCGDPHNQAWLRKDVFEKAQPVKGGIGMLLLQKMGWKEGEGLGRNKTGNKEPIKLDVKVDRKGLTSSEENVKKNPVAPVVKDLSGKHPVSALVELCNRKKWSCPEFIVVHESGPDHKKHFLFKVRVNGQEFQPTVASSNKKHAKAQSAAMCLQSLGLLPQ